MQVVSALVHSFSQTYLVAMATSLDKSEKKKETRLVLSTVHGILSPICQTRSSTGLYSHAIVMRRVMWVRLQQLRLEII